MQNLVIKEQLRKKVNKSGNSGAVWVPKAWLGEEILITRQDPKISGGDESTVLTERYIRAKFRHRGAAAKSERKIVYEKIIKDKLIITDDVYRTYKRKHMKSLRTVNYEFK